MTTYIISGGSISDELVKIYLNQEDEYIVIAADRGMECCLRLGIIPDYLIGDFDSASPEALEAIKQWEIPVSELNPIKDDTDTEAALHLAFAKTEGDIIIFGGTGTRLDHVLGNVAILGQGFEAGRKVMLIDSNNRIQLVRDEVVIKKNEQYGKYISVLPFTTKVTGLYEEGFYYPLNDYTLESFTSLGISNEIVAEVGRITVGEGIAIVIESRD